MSDVCSYCRQDVTARDHTGCEAWALDHAALVAYRSKKLAPATCADATNYVLAMAPVATRVAIAKATVDAWMEGADR